MATKGRLRVLVLSAVVAYLLLVTAVTPEVPVNAADPPVGDSSQTYLIRLGDRRLLSADVGTLHEVGFGWYTVEARPGQRDLRARLVDLGVEFEVDIVYELFADRLYPQQWDLENTGQLGGTVDADIDAPEAWTWTVGDPDQIIAVIDSGVDLDHPDLAERLWRNADEIPGNGLDDDNNGYIDDVNGWDIIDRDGVPQDIDGHGTAVAGIAVATSNDIGIVGVAPGATIMPVRACQAGSCSLSAVVEAIAYALDNGAGILNLSLGTTFPNQALSDAVSAANDAGVIVVAAAGNAGADNDPWPMYPASLEFPNVIAVAATDRDDALAADSGWASNYGVTSVDLAAPGKEIPTTGIDGWVTVSGTSFSVPLVAGVAALIQAIRPDATPDDVRRLILESVDPLPSLDGKVVSGGRLNADGAVQRASAPVVIASTTPASGTVPFTVSLDASDSYDPIGSLVEFTWELPDGQILSGPVTQWSLEGPGEHTVKLSVTDDDGFTSTTNLTINANASPVAVASGSPTLGWAPLSVAASGSGSFDPDGAIVAWEWTGGTSNATGADTTITLETVGIRDVELTVTDDFGATATDTLEILVGADFIDTRKSIFRLDIAWLSALGITKGCNPPGSDRYCPKDPLTREQMAAFLSRVLDLPPTTTDYFTDDNGSIYENDINRLAQAGITNGCNPPTNDHYCPQDPVSRQQISAFLTRALNLPPTTTDYFTDDNGSIYENDINRLAQAGITKGCNPPTNDHYCPQDPVSRQQMAAFIRRGYS